MVVFVVSALALASSPWGNWDGNGGLYDGPLPWSAALTPGDDASMYPGLFSKGVGESSRDV